LPNGFFGPARRGQQQGARDASQIGPRGGDKPSGAGQVADRPVLTLADFQDGDPIGGQQTRQIR
jgi:hypothetical protein